MSAMHHRDDETGDQDFDPERIVECAYWRCGELFEARTSNQRFCRKACRSRQRKWERAQERRRRRQNPVVEAPAGVADGGTD